MWQIENKVLLPYKICKPQNLKFNGIKILLGKGGEGMKLLLRIKE